MLHTHQGRLNFGNLFSPILSPLGLAIGGFQDLGYLGHFIYT